MTPHPIKSIAIFIFGLAGAFGCTQAEPVPEPVPKAVPPAPDTPVLEPTPVVDEVPTDDGVELPPQPGPAGVEMEAILRELERTKDLTADQLVSMYAVSASQPLSYVPSDAVNLGIIQNSGLALTADELDALDRNGLVIADSQVFPSFTYGYETLYLEDLPLFVSADSIMSAVHRSYDSILAHIEANALLPRLDEMLVAMRENLAAGQIGSFGPQVEADLDLYLGLALSLLRGETVDLVRGADAAQMSELFDMAIAASGAKTVNLFGVQRPVDFSQFKPRGHYRGRALKRYFRSMMWFGRIDFRILETRPDHTQIFRRRQLEAAYAMRALMGPSEIAAWELIDRTIATFVGEADHMELPELDRLLAHLGLSTAADLDQRSDLELARGIVEGEFGTQRISSHFMVNGLAKGTMPLSSTFLFLGQRYVLDSHVLSNLVYDRVSGGGSRRDMPNSLDVAFAALQNDRAASLLRDELLTYDYAPDLHAMRFLADGHGAPYWTSNLYNAWMSALRALSPANAPVAGMPEIAGTDAWGRRILNAQLASWAELRHDTILYAKQSYGASAPCEFPDAYVDPYPEFYGRLAAFALKGQDIVATLGVDGASGRRVSIGDYFVQLYEVANLLQEMAQYQLDGIPFTDTHLAFINESVRIERGCSGPSWADGWYPGLHWNPGAAAEFDPTVADVHTSPTGEVLHVGTGYARYAVITVNTCTGVRAYAGLVSSFFEEVKPGLQRMTDPEWASEVQARTPVDVPWMQDSIVP